MRASPLYQCICCLGLMVPLMIIMGVAAMNAAIFKTGGNVGVAVFNIVLSGVVLVFVLLLITGLMLKRGPLGALSRRAT